MVLVTLYVRTPSTEGDYWYSKNERSLLWRDLTIGSQSRVDSEPKLAAKDAAGNILAEGDF